MIQEEKSERIHFESSIDLQMFPYLRDYQLYKTHILPFAAFLEMALVAAHDLYRLGAYSLDEIVHHEALQLSANDRCAIEMTVLPEGHDSHRFAICSLLNSDAEAILHTSGRISSRSAVFRSAKFDLDALRVNSVRTLAAQDFYTYLDTLGLHYGPSFQSIQQLWCREDEALGQMELPAVLQPEAMLYQMHPVLLDACIQILLAALPARQDLLLYVPVGLTQLNVFARPGTEIWVHARLHDQAEETSGILEGEVTLLDGQGYPLAQMSGVRLQPLTGPGYIISDRT